MLPAKKTSLSTRKLTLSLNVIVKSNAPDCTPEGTEISTLGASISTMTVCVSAAVFRLVATSIAAPAGILITTSPLAMGVIVAVYVMSSVAVKDVTLAVVVLSDNEISSFSKPETTSLNTIVISNALFCASEGTETVTPGASPSISIRSALSTLPSPLTSVRRFSIPSPV